MLFAHFFINVISCGFQGMKDLTLKNGITEATKLAYVVAIVCESILDALMACNA